jgi:hypothetical protein
MWPLATISAIDLSKIDSLCSSLYAFAGAVDAAVTDTTIQSTVQNIITACENFEYNGASFYYIDLWDLARLVAIGNYADAEAAALQNAVLNTVVDEWHYTGTSPYAHTYAHGISIYAGNEISTAPFVDYDIPYCRGYVQDYPLAFVQDPVNTWVGHWDTQTLKKVGPGLLWKLWVCQFP